MELKNSVGWVSKKDRPQSVEHLGPGGKRRRRAKTVCVVQINARVAPHFHELGRKVVWLLEAEIPSVEDAAIGEHGVAFEKKHATPRTVICFKRGDFQRNAVGGRNGKVDLPLLSNRDGGELRGAESRELQSNEGFSDGRAVDDSFLPSVGKATQMVLVSVGEKVSKSAF